MSTLKATVDMVELLNEESLIKIQNVINQLLMNQNMNDAKSVMTRQKFLDELEISRQQFNAGQSKDAREAVNNMREKYDCMQDD